MASLWGSFKFNLPSECPRLFENNIEPIQALNYLCYKIYFLLANGLAFSFR